MKTGQSREDYRIVKVTANAGPWPRRDCYLAQEYWGFGNWRSFGASMFDPPTMYKTQEDAEEAIQREIKIKLNPPKYEIIG